MSIDPRQILPLLPDKPGVYEFLDGYGNIIYVGKAKNLKKRVTSYFSKNQSGKTSVMLKKAAVVRHIVVENESDALLLENNIIKNQQPRYNILLKDDKTYPWICIKERAFSEGIQHTKYNQGRISLFWSVYLRTDGKDTAGTYPAALQA